MTTTVQTAPTRPDARTATGRRLRRAATLVAAAVAATIVWIVCVPVLGIDLTVNAGGAAQAVTLPSVIIVPILTGGVAWALLALFERMLRHGRRVWLIVACVVLALALLEPLAMMASPTVLVSLLALHLVTGATLVTGLALSAAPAARSE
jgi:hypothetical protein